MWVQSLGQEDSLEEGMATHSSIPAWGIPRQRSMAGYSPWGHRVTHDWATEHTHIVTLPYQEAQTWQVAKANIFL